MKFVSVSVHEAERMRKGGPEECGQDAKHLGLDRQPPHQLVGFQGLRNAVTSDFPLSSFNMMASQMIVSK